MLARRVTSKPENPSSASSASAAASMRLRRMTPLLAGQSPRNRFSARLSVGTGASSCGMNPMPWRMASRGEVRRTACPSTMIAPPSGVATPASSFASVDLPAPFSPTSATTSPELTVRDKSVSTLVGPYDLTRPSNTS